MAERRPETEQVGPHDVHLLPQHPDYRDHVACRACGAPSRPSIERGLWEERNANEDEAAPTLLTDELAEALHRYVCAEPWDACCWAGEDPDLTDCRLPDGTWRPTGVEPALAPVIEARLRAAAALTRRAVLDPGAFVKRGADYEGNAYGERLDHWQDRAIEKAVGLVSRPEEQG